MADFSIQELVKMLKSENPDDRREAVKKITLNNDPDMLIHITPLSSDSDASVRYYVKKAIASLQARQKQKTVVTTVAIPKDVREEIIQIQKYADSGDTSRIDMLLGQLAMEENKYIKATLIKALGKLGDISVSSSLIQYLKDPDTRVVANTVEALEEIGDPESQVAMLDLLTHPDTRVKGNVARALWNNSETDSIGSSLILDRLREMIESDKPWFRESAVYVLGKIGTDKALTLLRLALTDRDEQIRKMAQDIFAVKEKKKKAVTKKKLKEVPVEPKKTVKKLVHVNQTSKEMEFNPLLIKFQQLIDRIWNPQKDLRENIITSSLVILIGIVSMFVILVFINIGSMLLSSDTNIETVTTVKKSVKINENMKIARNYYKARQYQKIISQLGALTELDEEEKEILVKSYIKHYKNNIKDGDLSEAINILKNWNSTIPDSSDAHVYMGNFLLKYRNDLDDAKNHYRAALKLDKNSSSAMIGMGDIEFFNGEAKMALVKYRTAYDMDKDNSRALFSIANASAMNRNYEDAEKYFNLSIKLDPLNQLAYLGLGKTLAKKGDTDEAIKQFETAIEIDPELIYAKYEIAKIVAKSDKKSALRMYKEVLEKHIETPEIIRDYGILLMKMKIYSKAAKVFDEYLKMRPQNAEILGQQGGAYLAMELPGEGKEKVEKALTIDPKSGVANYNMGIIYEQGAEFDLALDHFRKAFDSNYESKATILNMSNIYMKSENYGKAREIVEMGLNKFPDDQFLLYNSGMIHYLEKDNDEARKIFLKLVTKIDKNNVRLLKRVKYFMKKLGISEN